MYQVSKVCRTVHEEDCGKENEWGDSVPTCFGAIYSESDARLMAQSKNMYEAMSRMLEDFDKWGTRDMGEDNFEEVRAILSEIDKE